MSVVRRPAAIATAFAAALAAAITAAAIATVTAASGHPDHVLCCHVEHGSGRAVVYYMYVYSAIVYTVHE